MKRVVIVGGGISGLSTAYYLAKAGIPSTLIERRGRLGGVIRTDLVHGCVIEAGPDSFLAVKPAALELIRELGLFSDVIGSNDHLRVTYVWKRGELVPLPDGLMLMVPTRIMPMVSSSLLGWGTKIRMGLEYFRRPNGAAPRDRSVADFIQDHYGAETVDYLAEPLLAGVYGGDPRQLSVASVLTRFVDLESKYGSLTKGVLAERRKANPSATGPLFRTLKGGLEQLTAALIQAIGTQMNVVQGEAETVERSDAGYQVRVNGDWIQADHVVLACQAWQAGAVLVAIDGELSADLSAIPYNSSMTLALGYEKSTFGRRLDGFGFLVPKKERRLLVACTWVGTKFSNRVPEDKVVLRCFLGGAGNEAVLELPDETIVAGAREEIREMMGVTAEPAFARISRWPRSMAQYTVGHQERVERIEKRLACLPGLHLAGNGYYGIGVPDCIRMGRQAAERIAGK